MAFWRTPGIPDITSSGSSPDGLRYITVNITVALLEVVATPSRNGSCYRCGLLLNPQPIFSEEACLLVIGPPSAPRVVLFDRTLTSITVEWFEPFTDSAHPVLYYEVSLDGGETRVFPSSGRMTTFTGLTHSTGYTIRVRANNTIGFGPSGNLTTATVSPLAPPKPIDLASRVEFRSGAVRELLASWKAPSLNTSHTNITGYTFSYKLSTSTTFTQTNLPANATSMAIPGVVTVRTYNIRVAALNDVGPSENAELDIVAAYIQKATVTTSPETAVFTCEVAYNDRTDLSCEVSIIGLGDHTGPVQSGSPPTAVITVGSLRAIRYNAVVRVVDNVHNVRVESAALSVQFTVPFGTAPGGSAGMTSMSWIGTLLAASVATGLALMLK